MNDRRVIALVFSVLVVALFVYVCSPLVLPLVMGAILAVLLMPVQLKLELWKFKTTLAAALLTLGLTLVVLLPAVILGVSGAKAGIEQISQWRNAPGLGSNWADNLLNSPNISRLVGWVTHWLPVSQEQIVNASHDLARAIGVKLADWLGSGLAQLPGLTLAITIMVVSVFFFLLDGRRLVAFFRHNKLLETSLTETLIHSLEVTCRSVILASVVSGAIQAAVFTLSCLVSSVDGLGLIFTLVLVFSFIPVVGTLPVTLAVVIQQWAQGHAGVALALVIVAVFVTILDNFIRPVFLQGSAAKLHPLLAFVAAFGGLQTIGVVGIFVGPVLASMFMVMIHVLNNGGGDPKALAPK